MSAHRPLPFARRHIGPAPDDLQAMLNAIGQPSLDGLIDTAAPESIRHPAPLDLPAARTEIEALADLRRLAEENTVLTSLIGMGYHDTVIPAVILRNVFENPAWYTAYTPYQPEISQGRLEAILNFQTMVCDLTGADIANASMLDEGTAAVEAMTMALRSMKGDSAKRDRRTFFVDSGCHPQTIDVVTTRAEPLGIEVVLGSPADLGALLGDGSLFGALLAHVSTTGEVRDLTSTIESIHACGAFAAVTTDLLACTILRPPGEMGADAVVGSAQRYGVPLGYGGPHAGFLATTTPHTRVLPGRLVGVSVDRAGRRALRLALQTREQHIRREKATSNICTAQVLLAVMASMYAAYHGPDGLTSIAEQVRGHADRLAAALTSAGLELAHDTWFDTITAVVPGRSDEIVAAALARGVNLRRVDADRVGVSFDETSTPALVAEVVAAFGATSFAADTDGEPSTLPEPLRRTTTFLEHPTFHRYRSETEMLRYLRRLADKDIALDRAMIPLGSCTMKLNATSEMIPVSWPEFSRLHPFVPAEQATGYRRLFRDLEDWLVEITGYDAVSLQPNAGSQGEYAGLLAIRGYHRSRGDVGRDVCLIPSSAHGTNAASAVMAGMRVVVVACDADGNVDIDDLVAKADEHAEQLSALMVTYPSTHGVFEESIVELCDIIHERGGQVYLDGANMNALVGVGRPGSFGADVSHLNLHKTFCIPHGGGGPGVGPIGVRSHLTPFLPNHPLVSDAGPDTGPGAIAAAPWGSASILPISWMYIAMMGPDGLREATASAILAANYVAYRLRGHFPVLYTGIGGLVAHECIIDIRPLEKDTGVTAEDIAKRLIDHGFHAPTMSFPVAGTLMIEPTESESLAELDRFCDSMISIRGEIAEVADGVWVVEESPLRLAPHTADDLLADQWTRPYPARLGAYPDGVAPDQKYWPPVGRVDNGYGDRNLMCACPPVESFADPG